MKQLEELLSSSGQVSIGGAPEGIDALTRLIAGGGRRIVLTTVAALMQRVPPRAALAERLVGARVGERLDPDALAAFCGAFDSASSFD